MPDPGGDDMSRYDQRESNVMASCMLLVIGAAFGITFLMVVRSFDKPRPLDKIDCLFCHYPILRTYKQYSDYHAPKKGQKFRTVKSFDPLLAELVRP